MKKIGIITIHAAHNYGAVLQAYALQRILSNLGFQSEIINYVNKRDQENKMLFHRKLSPSSILHNLRTASEFRARKTRYKAFEDFIQSQICLSKLYFNSPQDLNDAVLDYDIFITGSDQTFNICLAGSFEDWKPYYLTFVQDGRKKISYAASFGEHIEEFQTEHIHFAANALKQYDALGVREQSGIEFIKKIAGLDSELVLDPTLLLTRNDWDSLTSDTDYIKGEYILYYSVLADQWSVNQVKILSKKMNLPVIAPHLKNRFEVNSHFIRATNTGPLEFISLVKHAKFVCTTSFHATALSLIYNKPFYSLKYGKGARIGTLLSLMGFSDRLIDYKADIPFEQIDDIDFMNSELIMEKLRDESIDYLKRCINNGRIS